MRYTIPLLQAYDFKLFKFMNFESAYENISGTTYPYHVIRILLWNQYYMLYLSCIFLI